MFSLRVYCPLCGCITKIEIEELKSDGLIVSFLCPNGHIWDLEEVEGTYLFRLTMVKT